MLNFFNKYDKKIFFVILACAIIAIICGIIYFVNNNNSKNDGVTVIKSFDETCSINVPDNLKLISNRNTGEFLIDLYSQENNMYIYCTQIKKTRAIDLLSAIADDKNSYLADKTNIRENSDITKLEHTYNSYEYSFKYLDTECNGDFYCNVVWYETENSVYILNFEAPASSCDEFKSVFNEMKASFITNHSIY